MNPSGNTEYANETRYPLGKLVALLTLLQQGGQETAIRAEMDRRCYRYVTGRVGSMELVKVIAAIETAAKAAGVIDPEDYREVHALYHATLEAVQGVGRGTLQFGEILRTVGLTFCTARGEVPVAGRLGEWIAVCIYGTIGAPRKGFEHEVIGFGYNHL